MEDIRLVKVARGKGISGRINVVGMAELLPRSPTWALVVKD